MLSSVWLPAVGEMNKHDAQRGGALIFRARADDDERPHVGFTPVRLRTPGLSIGMVLRERIRLPQSIAGRALGSRSQPSHWPGQWLELWPLVRASFWATGRADRRAVLCRALR